MWTSDCHMSYFNVHSCDTSLIFRELPDLCRNILSKTICLWSGQTGFNCWTPAFQGWFAVGCSSCFISVVGLGLCVRWWLGRGERVLRADQAVSVRMWATSEPRVRLLGCGTGLGPPPSELLLTVPGRRFCCGLF